jgi:anti-sigma factor RsiW
MDFDSQLKLQAFLDGELPEREALAVASQLAQDSESAALLTELRNTRKALKGFESDIELPESREFFWSKIERDIARFEQAESPAREPEPFFAWWRRYLVPSGAFAALLLMAVVAVKQLNWPVGSGFLSQDEAQQSVAVETAFNDTGAFTYRDQSAGITVVWLSYPSENEFADTDSFDTID